MQHYTGCSAGDIDRHTTLFTAVGSPLQGWEGPSEWRQYGVWRNKRNDNVASRTNDKAVAYKRGGVMTWRAGMPAAAARIRSLPIHCAVYYIPSHLLHCPLFTCLPPPTGLHCGTAPRLLVRSHRRQTARLSRRVAHTAKPGPPFFPPTARRQALPRRLSRHQTSRLCAHDVCILATAFLRHRSLPPSCIDYSRHSMHAAPAAVQ